VGSELELCLRARAGVGQVKHHVQARARESLYMRCVIGLGANLGDRISTLEAAVREIALLGDVAAISHLYRTRPVGVTLQPYYYNAAVCLRTALKPQHLLERLLQIERIHGRIREAKWGPRTLDLDLLWIERFAIKVRGLTVPHPQLVDRAFALVPLLDVAPDAQEPCSGRAYRDMPVDRTDEAILQEGTMCVPAKRMSLIRAESAIWVLHD
jgi:2-amino-4-hydroxy-6-hydroxymethyldihydropteridine diphosphokinase